MCLYVLSFVLWCLYLQLFVFTFLYLFAHSGVQHILCCGFILFFFYAASFSRLSIFDLPRRYSLMFIIFVIYIFTNSKNVTKLLGWNHKYSPVDAGQWQLRQPLESIATQLISHVDASNGGHPPAPCPPPADDCVVPEVTGVVGGTNKWYRTLMKEDNI